MRVKKIFLCLFIIIINTFAIENQSTIGNQSIEYNKIINVYYDSNYYYCFAIHMSINNNQSLILLMMIY